MIHFKYRPHYFSYKLNREVEEIYWHSILNSLALSLVFIFEPIYLYSIGYSLVQIMWFYVQVYSWYVILISFGAKFASRFGYKHSIFVSNIFYVIYWLALFSITNYPGLFFVAPILFALQKSWFWPAYNADVALFSAQSQRGREVGVLFSLVQLSFIAGPVLGGLISQQFGFLILFISASAVMMLSVYPLFKSPDIHSTHEFKFENLRQVFRNHKRNFFGYWGYAEDLMLMSLWPVYIFIVLPNLTGVGTVSTVATLVGTVLMLYVGKLTDKSDKVRLIRGASIFYGITWLLRFLSKGLPGVLTFDALTKTGKDIVNVPMVALTFERAGDKGPDYAIAYSVFYEFSLSCGKIFAALAAIAILSAGLSIFWVFASVGILTMFYGLLK